MVAISENVSDGKKAIMHPVVGSLHNSIQVILSKLVPKESDPGQRPCPSNIASLNINETVSEIVVDTS